MIGGSSLGFGKCFSADAYKQKKHEHLSLIIRQSNLEVRQDKIC
jgi:hypothetical protein